MRRQLNVQEGYLIPKGAAIVGNHWSIHRDPQVFPEPDNFRPERWLEPRSGKDQPWVPTKNKNIRHFTYGFGRRVCPGQHVADRSVFINVRLRMLLFTRAMPDASQTAMILWAYKLCKKVDASGKEIEIDTMDFTSTANSFPAPGMPVRFEPRFEGVVAQIENLEGW